jgi:hypothetical protein
MKIITSFLKFNPMTQLSMSQWHKKHGALNIEQKKLQIICFAKNTSMGV